MATVNLGRVGLVLKGDWDSATAYVPLDVVSHNGSSWAAKANSTNVEPTTEHSDSWQLLANNAEWVAQVEEYLEQAEQYSEAAVKALANQALGYSDQSTYNVGDYVLYNDVLYICKTAVTTAEAWDSTKWDQTYMADSIGNLILVQPSQPTETANKIWVDSDDTEEYQVPSWAEFEDLEALVYGGDWDLAAINRLIWMGLGPKAVPVGTALVTEKETGVSATIGTSVEGGTPSISGATIDEDTFINKVASSMAGAYEFTYDGATWQLNGEAVEIAQYGITVTGTPATGDEIVVHVEANEIPLNVLDHDYHTPISANVPHTCTVGMRDCYQNFAFDAPEGLIHVVDGLSAGSHFYLTLDHGAYNATTAQDGTYGGTLGADQMIPAGGYLRHTAIGAYQSSAYTPEQITNGKWISYDANFVQIGAQIATDTGDTTGTNFGTATAAIYQGNSAHVNFTTRNAYGCNRLDQSNWLQYANAEGTGWWAQKNEWDFPPSGVATLKGLMTGLDPVMKASMVPVKIRFALANCDGGGYVDVETKVFPLSMSEVNFGQNNGVWETSFGLDNTLIQRPLAFYTGAQNADRIKTLNGAARYWFLRGAYPYYANDVLIVNTSGALSHSSAYYANGLVAAWVIGNPNIASA